MPISVDDALAQLNDVTSVNQLRAIVESLSVDLPSAETFVFYSGDGQFLGYRSEDVAKALVEHTPSGSIGIINNTDRATFLDTQAFKDKLLELVSGRGPYEDALFIGQDSFWGQASADFAANANGNVISLTANANPGRIWSDVEVEELLRNDSVTHINGLSKPPPVGVCNRDRNVHSSGPFVQ